MTGMGAAMSAKLRPMPTRKRALMNMQTDFRLLHHSMCASEGNKLLRGSRADEMH